MTAYAGDKITPLRKLRVLRALCGEIMVNLRKSCGDNVLWYRGSGDKPSVCPYFITNGRYVSYTFSTTRSVVVTNWGLRRVSVVPLMVSCAV